MTFVDPIGDMITRIRNAQMRLLNNVKIIAIGKEEYSGSNTNWMTDNIIPVVVDSSPLYDTWTSWNASQRDLFFLDSNIDVISLLTF